MKPRRLIVLIVAMLALGSCNRGAAITAPFSAKLTKAADVSDLERRVKLELTRKYERQGEYYTYYGINPYAMIASGDGDGGGQPNSTNSGNGGLDTSHSETNVQVAGVDEGDFVKTDGIYLFLARGSHFLVLLANPASQTAVISDINLPESITELYLQGNQVLIVTRTWSNAPGSAGMRTRLYGYDISKPEAPVRTVQLDFPGSLQGSRRIDSVLYIVTNHTVDIPDPAWPWEYFSQAQTYAAASDLAFAENRRQIEALTIADIIPSFVSTSYSGGVAGPSSMVPAVLPGDVYIPEFGNGADIALVFTIDLSGAGSDVVASAGVFSSWCTLYMSTDSLYLASDNFWQWIEPLFMGPQPSDNPEPGTALHKFSVRSTPGELDYRGSAVVAGWLNDKFSMDEYQGVMRIGTTRGGWWGEGISNQLTVLADGNGGLRETGRLTGLAPGERIYSMRYDRDRGYMVTFRQTDPLFTLDLTDPENPRLAGEIHVNGFSTYIHLLGPNNSRLLTIGRSADAYGIVTGNKLQLFNVADLTAPALLGEHELGSGWSDALYDPHAFLYYEPLEMLAVPYFAYAYDTGSYTSGLSVFAVGSASIELKGVIPAPAVTTGYGTYLDTVDRSVVIGTTIYSLAHRSVTAADTDQLNIISTVGLPEMYGYSIAGGGTAGGVAVE